MKKIIHCTAALFLVATIDAQAADVAAGKATFDSYCSECHAPAFGHPGTQQLGWTRGERRAVLEQRTDLAPTYVVSVVRQGLFQMPAFRPTEIDDLALRQLAAYLAKSRKSS